MTRAVVLVSVGRHPVSGRARRATFDAHAVELGQKHFGGHLVVVHAGDAGEVGLRDYLGMGLTHLTVLRVAVNFDPLAPIVAWLRQERPDVILMGSRTESDEATGMFPYLLAEALQVTLVSSVVDLQLDKERVIAIQGLKAAGRRLLAVDTPMIAVLAPSGRWPRQMSPRARVAGTVHAIDTMISAGDDPPGYTERPARRRPKRLKTSGTTLGDRLSALTGGGSNVRGSIIQGTDPAEAARTLLAFLRKEGVVRSEAGTQSSPTESNTSRSA